MEKICVEMKSSGEKIMETLPKSKDMTWQTNEKPSETKSNEAVLSCKTCDIKLENRTQLLEHMRLKHKACPYKCSKCKRSFSNKMELNDHQAIHSITGLGNYQCAKCSFNFVSIQYLNCHVRDVHSDKKFTCDLCNKHFRALRYLNEHKSKVHSGKEKPKCPICQKEFRGKGELKTHSVIHTGERPYQCLICSKSFRARSNLDVHIKIHNEIKDYVCNFCSRAFIVKNDLKRHLTIHFGSKDFSCEECGKKFNRKYQLEKHSFSVHGKSKTKESLINMNLVIEDENVKPQNNNLMLQSSAQSTAIHHLKSSNALASDCISITQCSPSLVGNMNEINNSDHLVMVMPTNNNNDLIIMGNDIKVIDENMSDSRMFVLDESGTITLSDSHGTNTVIFTNSQDTDTIMLPDNNSIMLDSDNVACNIDTENNLNIVCEDSALITTTEDCDDANDTDIDCLKGESENPVKGDADILVGCPSVGDNDLVLNEPCAPVDENISLVDNTGEDLSLVNNNEEDLNLVENAGDETLSLVVTAGVDDSLTLSSHHDHTSTEEMYSYENMI